jgi:hypothetical protein
MSDSSALELFSSDFVAIDGYDFILQMVCPCPYEPVFRYEFAPNEFVNSLACVPLETLSTESGHKDFIAVGTTINRGEDLAVKGAVRIRYLEHLHPLLIAS